MSLFQTVKYALCEETGGSFRSLVIRPHVVSVPGHFDPIISLSFHNVCSIGFNSKTSLGYLHRKQVCVSGVLDNGFSKHLDISTSMTLVSTNTVSDIRIHKR